MTERIRIAQLRAQAGPHLSWEPNRSIERDDLLALLDAVELADELSAYGVLQHDGYVRCDADQMSRLRNALARFDFRGDAT